MNMMRKNNNNRNNKHRSGGQRRYGNNNGGGGGSRPNDGQNLQRQKHHATQQLGKYGDMARNAQINGDRVDVEYYLQHVDHYTRVLADIAAIEAERFVHQRESQIIPGGPNDPNANQGGEQGDTSGETGDDAAPGAAAPEATADAAPAVERQPRQHRQRQTRPDNGAREANSNTTDIPLPGGIIPPI